MAVEALWDFAIRCYGAPGVEEACLALQDHHNGDVCVLLYALWLGRQGRRVASSDLDTVSQSVAVWRDGVVVPLRTIRRALREASSGVLSSAANEVRETLKSLELKAERSELEYLETMQVGGVSQTDGQAPERNVLAYLEFLGVDPSDYGIARIAALVDAVRRLS